MSTTEQIARPGGVAFPRSRTRTESATNAIEQGEVVSLSGERVSTHIGPLEWLLYVAFLVSGAVMRLWDLGTRALHHDESLHATYSWYLWQKITGASAGQEYHYDPMMHGPYQFHGNALMYLLFGPSAMAARLNAAICGTALILLPLLLRRQIGRTSALILSALLAFSPGFLYYSRFTREDIYFALWTMLFFVGFIRWLDGQGRPGQERWLYVASAGFALSWATKESTYFTLVIAVGFVVGLFVVGYLYQFLTPRRAPAPAGGRRAAPVREDWFTASLGSFARVNLPPLVTTLRGTPLRAWLVSLGVVAVITYILFLPIGDAWQWGFIPGNHMQPTTDATGASVNYNTDFLTGGLSYWKLQQSVQRGGQPWYYYFLVIPLYEQVTVVFGAAGLVTFFAGKGWRSRVTLLSGVAFVVLTLLALFVGPTLGKLANEALLGLAGLSGVILMLSQPRTLLINLMLWWTVLTWALYTYAGEKMPWLTIHIVLPTAIVAAIYAGRLLTGLPRLSVKWLVAVGLLALCSVVSLRSSVALAYVDGANPTEMLIYTQTSQDVPNASNVIHQLPFQTTASGTQVRTWVDGADSWPWVWYLHDEPATAHSFQGSDTDPAGAGVGVLNAAQQRYPAIIVGWEDHENYLKPKGKLPGLANYTGYEFKLRWWFPEDGYKAWETTGVSGFLSDALNPTSWGSIAAWWATRQPFDQQAFKNWTNSYRFFVYIRKDLATTYVPASWASAQQKAAQDSVYTPPAQVNDAPGTLTRPLTPLRTIDIATLAQPMAAVRALAVDSAGNLYATDSSAQHVVKFSPNGTVLTRWGSIGSGPGQFSNQYGGTADPLGVAVGPNGHIYVADTWNGRVQEFMPDGTIVRSFGTPNPPAANGAPGAATDTSFYGPRQVAVGPNGYVYVADTGNERIQVYSSSGVHLFNFGGGSHNQETTLGRFDEPSGVAVDSAGVVYVADYWDKRIQRFTADGKPINAYTINGWASGDYGEPYLAVDKAGHIFATDAPATINTHAAHVLELNAATGAVVAAYGSLGAGAPGSLNAPSGVAVGPDGSLYIADTGAGKIYKIHP